MVTEFKRLWADPSARKWLRRIATLLFLLIVTVLIYAEARAVEWEQVGHSIREYQQRTLALAGVFTAVCYLICGCVDWPGRSYLGGKPSRGEVFTAAFISYGFNQSLGLLVGSIAFRVRLYSRLGLDAIEISKMITMSLVTNWMGYSIVAGVVFLMWDVSLPAGWEMGEDILRLAGAFSLTLGVGYLFLCAFGRQREVRFKGRAFKIPSLRIALAQIFISGSHWPFKAAIVYYLLGGQLDFVSVSGGLLLCAVAAVIAHIPAGIGILEAIFIALAQGKMPTHAVLAALLVFRAIYFLAPLAVAALVYAGTEARAPKPQTIPPPQAP